MVHDVAPQVTPPPRGGTSPFTRGRITIAAVVLLVVGAIIGAAATAVVNTFSGPSLTDMAVGVWTCDRTGGDGAPAKGKVFIGRGSWAVVQTDDAAFREGGTWKLASGRLVVTSHEVAMTIEGMPDELVRNKELRVKRRLNYDDRDTETSDGSAEYANEVLTLRWNGFTFRCTKDR